MITDKSRMVDSVMGREQFRKLDWGGMVVEAVVGENSAQSFPLLCLAVFFYFVDFLKIVAQIKV